MRSLLAAVALLGAALLLAACGGGDDDGSDNGDGGDGGGGKISVSSWGGSWTEAEEEFIGKPFTEDTGIEVEYVVTGESPTAPALLQAESGNVRLDVINSENTDLLRQEGYLATFPDELQTTLEETSRPDGFTEDSIVFGATANIIACNPDVMERCPTNAEEFWDVDGFPGPRAIFDQAEGAMSFALLADGVPPDEVYPLDIDRAIDKLEEIKPEIRVWPASGDEQQQVLISEEVGAAIMWNGRAFVVQRDNIPDLELYWDGATISEASGLVVMKDAPNQEGAFEYINWIATHPEAQAAWTEALTYLTPSKELIDLVDPAVAKALPISHQDDLIVEDNLWLVENSEAIEQAWQQFLAG